MASKWGPITLNVTGPPPLALCAEHIDVHFLYQSTAVLICLWYSNHTTASPRCPGCCNKKRQRSFALPSSLPGCLSVCRPASSHVGLRSTWPCSGDTCTFYIAGNGPFFRTHPAVMIFFHSILLGPFRCYWWWMGLSFDRPGCYFLIPF